MSNDLGYFGNEASKDMQKRKATVEPIDYTAGWEVERTGKKVCLAKSNMLKKLGVL
jgi:hypothetical protein